MKMLISSVVYMIVVANLLGTQVQIMMNVYMVNVTSMLYT